MWAGSGCPTAARSVPFVKVGDSQGPRGQTRIFDRDRYARQARIEQAYVDIERLQTKLQGKRCRLRLRERVEEAVQKTLKEAYKFQPKLEKRHAQLKSVQNLAPMWLKNVSRIEAL